MEYQRTILDTEDEIERDRNFAVAKVDAEKDEDKDDPDLADPDWRERFLPGTFGCHEALHAASIMMSNVGDHLLSHPAVMLDKEAYLLAFRAHEYLFALYQRLGYISEKAEESGDGL